MFDDASLGAPRKAFHRPLERIAARDADAHDPEEAIGRVGTMACALVPLSLGATYAGFFVPTWPVLAALAYIPAGLAAASSARWAWRGAQGLVVVAGLLQAASEMSASRPLAAMLCVLTTVAMLAMPRFLVGRSRLPRKDERPGRTNRTTDLCEAIASGPAALLDCSGTVAHVSEALDRRRGLRAGSDLALRVHLLDRRAFLDALDRATRAGCTSELDLRIADDHGDGRSSERVRLRVDPFDGTGLACVTFGGYAAHASACVAARPRDHLR